MKIMRLILFLTCLLSPIHSWAEESKKITNDPASKTDKKTTDEEDPLDWLSEKETNKIIDGLKPKKTTDSNKITKPQDTDESLKKSPEETEPSLIIRNVKITMADFIKYYDRVKAKWAYDHTKKRILRVSEIRDKQEKPKLRSGIVTDQKGNLVYLNNAGSVFAIKVRDYKPMPKGEKASYMCYPITKLSQRGAKAGDARVTIPVYSDCTLTEHMFRVALEKRMYFSEAATLYNRFKSTDITQRFKELDQRVIYEKKNLALDAKITVSGSKDPEKISTKLIADNYTAAAWMSELKEKTYIEFSWPESHRSHEFEFYTGIKNKKYGNYEYVAHTFEIEYFNGKEWQPMPGGKFFGNSENHLTVHCYPVQFSKIRINFSNPPALNSYIREIKIYEVTPDYTLLKPVIVNGKKLSQESIMNAHKIIVQRYGMKPNGNTPTLLSELVKTKAGSKSKIYVISGEVTKKSGAREIKIGNRGWMKLRDILNYNIGDYVTVLGQLSSTRRASHQVEKGINRGDNSENIYIDWTIHYPHFLKLIRTGYKFPEIKKMLE